MSNEAQHNRHQHNRGRAAAVTAAQNPVLSYRMEVRTPAGVLVTGLPFWSEGKTKDTANAHGDISIVYPYSATAWDYFAHGRHVWLYDDRGNIKEKYHIVKRTRRKAQNGVAQIFVEGRSLIYQLSREMIDNFYVGDESQTVTLPTSTGGTFTLTFRGQTTSALAYNVSAASVTTALEGLSTIGSGNVAVTGSAGGPFTVTFQGTLSQTNVPVLTASGASLTGGGAQVVVATTRATKTLAQTVAYLLSTYQVNSNPIYYGFIDNAIGANNVALKVENRSILACILELRDLYGGYFWVDAANRRFYWKRERGRRSGQYVRIGKNGQHIEEIEDYSTLATRITAIGKGQTIEDALSVTVNDATAQSAYGIVPDTIIDKSIWNTTDLTAFATANLNARKTPKKSYRVGVIDLARLTTADYSFHEFETGSHIRVMDTEFALTLDTTIAAIERDLDSPLQFGGGSGGGGGGGGGNSKVRIAVTNPEGANEPSVIPAEERDITDTIADLLDMAQDQFIDHGFEDAVGAAMEQILQQPGGGGVGETIVQQLQDIINQAVDDGTIDVPAKGTSIQTVGTANSAGSNTTYAADDHVHKGNHFSATDVASLPTLAEGNTWHITGATKRFGVYINSTAQIVSHI